MNLSSLVELVGPEIPSRIDVFCAQSLGLTRGRISALIQNGAILVNGKVIKPSFKVESGDQIHCELPHLDGPPEAVIPPSMPIPDILFEDASILVINKPVGVTVHSAQISKKGPFLTDWLVSYIPSLADVGEPHRPGIVHRLDEMTDGVMVVAKTIDALMNLKAQFKDRSVIKGYYAAVRGNLLSDEIIIDQPLERHSRNRKKMAVVTTGKPSISEVRVLRRFQSKTLVEVTPKTGRTHQIRVHLDFIGHPVIGDPVYGKSMGKRDGQRIQSFRLGFAHPVTGERMLIEVPMSERILQ